MSEGFAGAVGRFLDDLTPLVEGLGAAVPAIRADRLAGEGIAVRVGRMTVAIRRAHARAMTVETA